MGQDIFNHNRNAKAKAIASSEETVLTLGGSTEGYLIQNWRLSYQQTVQEIFELGSSNIYWVKGRPSGGGEIGRIIGANDTGGDLLPAEAYDACSGGVQATFQLNTSGCGNSQSTTLGIGGMLVQSVSFGSSVGQIAIQEGLTLRFASLTRSN